MFVDGSIWLTVPAFVGAMLWLVLGNTDALQRQLQEYAVEPHTARLRPPGPEGLAELVVRCQEVRPGPYSIFDQYTIRAETPTPRRAALLHRRCDRSTRPR